MQTATAEPIGENIAEMKRNALVVHVVKKFGKDASAWVMKCSNDQLRDALTNGRLPAVAGTTYTAPTTTNNTPAPELPTAAADLGAIIAAASPSDAVKESIGWYISRDDRGPDAEVRSSETLGAFVDEADARGECEKINQANRPTPTLVIFPRGVKFNGFEDFGTGHGTDRLFKVFVSFDGEDFAGRGWGETSYGRSGDEGLWRAMEDALHEAGFPNWTIKNATVKD
jgi:hypothetical protein